MNKRALSLVAAGLVAFTSTATLQGCYGNFALTKKVYKWNGTLGNKWINSIVMVGLTIIPVYQFSVFVDGVILNLVQFWTGSNPVAMQPGEKETQTVAVNGKTYIMTATQNHMEVALQEPGVKPVEFNYDPDQQAWLVVTEAGSKKIAEHHGDELTLFLADGTRQTLNR